MRKTADPNTEHIRRWDRRRASTCENNYDDGCLRVEHDAYYVACQGRLISLTKTEFLLVSRLARSFDRIVSAEELWVYAWGRRKRLNLDSLHVSIHRVRRKVAPYGLRIGNMIGVGYSLSHGTCCGRVEEQVDVPQSTRKPSKGVGVLAE